MTFRTTLLAICMIAVPAAALFSHRLPAEIRAAARAAVVTGMARCRQAAAAGLFGAGGDPGTVAPGTEPGPRVVIGAAASAPPAERPATTVTALDRLTALGATGLDCHPVPGPSGEHMATCHVALDAAGQLTRVFQATGHDGDAAVAALATEVERWRLRAVDPEHGGSAAAPRTLR